MTPSFSSCLTFPLLSSHTRISNSRRCKLTQLLQLTLLTIIVLGASADALARAQRTELNEVDIDGEEFSPDQYHIQGQYSIERNYLKPWSKFCFEEHLIYEC